MAKPSAFSKLRLSAAAIPGRKSLSKVGHVSHNPLFKQALTERYDRIFNQLENLSLVPVHREVLWQAAKLRAGQNLKTPDAIHLATALLTGCKALLSQDLGMPLLTNMPLWRLESLEDNLSLI